jgi:hypothetical protein
MSVSAHQRRPKGRVYEPVQCAAGWVCTPECAWRPPRQTVGLAAAWHSAFLCATPSSGTPHGLMHLTFMAAPCTQYGILCVYPVSHRPVRFLNVSAHPSPSKLAKPLAYTEPPGYIKPTGEAIRRVAARGARESCRDLPIPYRQPISAAILITNAKAWAHICAFTHRACQCLSA